MATSAELWSNYMELQRQANVSPDSFYNKSFVDRINDAQKNIDLMVEEKNQADSKRMQAQDAYDTFDGQMRNYSSMQDEAENKFGVTTAMENYEKSKYAVAAMEQTLSSLPSTINRTSNVVMSQQRRELAYNTQANKWEQSMRTKQAITDVNKEVWDNARKMSNEFAQQLYGEQESTREALSLQWSNATSEYQKSIDRWQDARMLLTELKSDYLLPAIAHHTRLLVQPRLNCATTPMGATVVGTSTQRLPTDPMLRGLMRSLRERARHSLKRLSAYMDASAEQIAEYKTKCNVLKRCSCDGGFVQVL